MSEPLIYQISVYRYNPEKDNKPYMQTYGVNRNEIMGTMLLDALEAIKTKDDSLAFRRSCGEGVCGSDGMNINGVNGLACKTKLTSLPTKIVLRPLPSMPVVRDLIVDLSRFYDHYEKVKPYLLNDQPLPDKERIQSEAERLELDGLYECILCACCTTACPSFWWNPDKFLGPAALLAACRFLLDSRDTDQKNRLQLVEDLYSLYRCRTIMNCTNVCPKGLNPAEAISKIRTKMVTAQLGSKPSTKAGEVQ